MVHMLTSQLLSSLSVLPVKAIADVSVRCCLLTLVNGRRELCPSRVVCLAAARRIVTLLQATVTLQTLHTYAQRLAQLSMIRGMYVGQIYAAKTGCATAQRLIRISMAEGACENGIFTHR